MIMNEFYKKMNESKMNSLPTKIVPLVMPWNYYRKKKKILKIT